MKSFRKYIMENFDHASIFGKFEDKALSMLKEIQDQIPKENLLSDKISGDESIIKGLQKLFHVTVLYGLKNSDIVRKDEMSKILDNHRKLRIFIYEDEVFRNDEDVNVLKISSPQLEQLHNQLKNNFPVVETYSEFKPHITLGYVKKGTGQKLNFLPFNLTIDEYVFSSKEGGKITL